MSNVSCAVSLMSQIIPYNTAQKGGKQVFFNCTDKARRVENHVEIRILVVHM